MNRSFSGNLFRWQAIFISILAVFSFALWTLYAQQKLPEGYLGPPNMWSGPSGPLVPEPPGPLGSIQAITLPNVRVNDKVGDEPNHIQSETTIAVDPTNPLRLVGGFNDSRGLDFPSRNGFSGWGFSINGGETWTGSQTGLPKADPSHFGASGDPSIDVDAQGNFYFASLYSNGPGFRFPLNISVHKGRFVGNTFVWERPTFATSFTSGFGSDKEHIGTDKRPGSQTVYVSYTNFTVSGNGQIEVVRSTDGGRTWSAPFVIAPASGVVHQGSVPRVGPDGEVYVAWEDGWPSAPRSIHIRKSTNWPNFGPDILVSGVTGISNPPFNSRVNDFPAMDIDRTNGPNRGRVYITWNDGRFGGAGFVGTILLAHSPDGSAGSWSAPIRLDDDRDPPSTTGNHRWFSWLAVDPRGVVNIAWYDRRLRGPNPALTDTFGAQFRLGVGVSPNFRITTRSFSMNVPARPGFVAWGDYNGAAVGPTRFHYMWGDGREGNPDAYAGGIIVSPILAEPISAEACRSSSTTTTITVLGGSGLFEDDVTLSLEEVSPPTSTITARFDPNPVPRPPVGGSNSTMTINTTAETPSGVYSLSVLGSDGNIDEETNVRLAVRSDVPDIPRLEEPVNGEDGVLEIPTFTWTDAEQAAKYRLQIFQGEGCTGMPVRDFDNIPTTEFTVPSAQVLAFFQRYSWRVVARNACGDTVSTQCFNFRTQSCVATPPHDVITNGGFEQDLTGWIIDAAVPRPVVVTEQRHSGEKSLRLGVIAEFGTPTQRGDSEVHQTVTIPETALNPRLSFWFFPQSAEFVPKQEVFIVPIDPPGPAVVLMREANNARTFINRTFSLDAFKGKTIEVHFRVHNDGNDRPAGMYLDDVSVTFGSCGEPDFFLTATAPTLNEVCAGSTINFTVGVVSLNGPNFTSPVRLRAENLPPGASVTFAQNPIVPGRTTTMTMRTVRPTQGGRFFFFIIGRSESGPPMDDREIMMDTFVSSNTPEAPEQITPLDGEVNVPIRPTLSWTEPFVPDAQQPPLASGDIAQMTGTRPNSSEPNAGDDIRINSFGAARYRVQVALDSAFTRLVVNAETTDTSFTLPEPALNIATQYFWRVSATNACGTSAFSETRSFTTGACFEGWDINPPVPIMNGPSQTSVVAAAGKIYVIGGGVGPGPSSRIREVWEFNPATAAWTRKADVPTPGPGSTFGSAAEFGGKIYVFGGISGPPGPFVIHNTLWIYDVATNTWRRGRDLPSPNFGTAVAVVGSKIILAGGSGFGNQTWEYDPATDTYRRLADALFFASRLHGAAIGNEMHVFGFTLHGVYNAATNTWSIAPPIPFFILDPAVAVLGGKYYVIGGRPIALTQIFDPATNTWSRGPVLSGLPNGLDNTAGAVLGTRIFVVGGFDGFNSVNAHRVFKFCGSTSAHFIPFVVDGDGTVSDIPNERTSLILSNDLNSTTTSSTVFFNTPDGRLDSSRTFSLAPRETKTLTDIIRQVRGGSDEVQNVKGSISIFATEAINALVSINNNDTGDQTILDGQTLAGIRNGFVPLVQLSDQFRMQVALNNASSRAAHVQLLAYPPEGGDTPTTSASVSVPPRGLVDFPDIVSALGLPSGHFGQLTWNSTQPITVFARDITLDNGFSGTMPVRSATDGSNTLFVTYVEDTESFSSHLRLNNVGPSTANVTVRFIEVTDPTGGTAGSGSSRDILVRVNSAVTIPDIIRWALRMDSEKPSGSRGFLVINSPQMITAFASIVNSASLDPAAADAATAMRNSFTPIILRLEPLAPEPSASSRIAIANPGTTAANVELMAFNPSGTAALPSPVRIRVVGNGQFFTEDIVRFLGLPPIFIGSMTITSDVPVLVFNQERTGDNRGTVVPVYPR